MRKSKTIFILGIVSISFLSTIMQRDFWPFSHFPMFSTHVKKNIFLPGYSLVGLDQLGGEQIITHRLILGAVHPAALSGAINRVVDKKDPVLLKELLKYWSLRYQQEKNKLPLQLQFLKRLQIKEMRSQKVYAEGEVT